MDEKRKASRGRLIKRPAITDIEQLDPEFKTGMLDGYGRAIQSMRQRDRDRILERIVTR